LVAGIFFLVRRQDAVVRFGPYRMISAKIRSWASEARPSYDSQSHRDWPAPVGFFAISERRYGEFLDQLDEIGVKNALASLFLALDAMQEIDIADTSGFGHWILTARTVQQLGTVFTRCRN